MYRKLEGASRTTEIRETEWVPAYLAGGVAPSFLWAQLKDVAVAPLGPKEIQRTELCSNAERCNQVVVNFRRSTSWSSSRSVLSPFLTCLTEEKSALHHVFSIF